MNKFFTFVVGGALGAVGALLFAPRSGEAADKGATEAADKNDELRQKIEAARERIAQQVKDNAQGVADKAKDVVDDTAKKADKAADEAAKGAEKAADKASK